MEEGSREIRVHFKKFIITKYRCSEQRPLLEEFKDCCCKDDRQSVFPHWR
ncbi:hypothetical protein MtrunA17_Chr2g0313221 [Medicago truncatula]|uniref:Uncharacterized protein n=1 Tax=Medicago truncatula TaxID=3880 RepID=A0A396JCA8_MEDTR|nr:hypothetical protein MtrunA17_Chr2g0313221 [Medicago truncatula]